MKNLFKSLILIAVLASLALTLIPAVCAESTYSCTPVDGILLSLTVGNKVTIEEAGALVVPYSEAELYEHMTYGIYGYDEEEEAYLCVGVECGTVNSEPDYYTLEDINWGMAEVGETFYVIDGTATLAKAPAGYKYHVAHSFEEIEPCDFSTKYTLEEYLDAMRQALVEINVAAEEAEDAAIAAGQEDYTSEYFDYVMTVVGKTSEGKYLVAIPSDYELKELTEEEIKGIFEDGEGEYAAFVLEAVPSAAGFPVWAIVLISVAVLLGAYVGCYFALYTKGKLTAAFFAKFFLPMIKICAKKA